MCDKSFRNYEEDKVFMTTLIICTAFSEKLRENEIREILGAFWFKIPYLYVRYTGN